MKHLSLLLCMLLLLAFLPSGLDLAPREIEQSSSPLTGDSSTVEDATLQMAYSEAIGGDDSTYYFQRSGMGYTATNPAHNLSIDVNDRALTISIGEETWQLSSDNAAHDFTLTDNRLTIHRDGFDEWYVNGPVGLQQGFTLYEPAEIAFDVGGTLTTTASAQSLSLGNSLTFSGLMAYDASRQNVSVEFNLAGNKLVYAYDDTDAAYPLTIDPWVQQTELVPSDGTSGDEFGYSVALQGDTALVGARSDNYNGDRTGSAYVFIRMGTTWTEQAKLVINDGIYSDGFGNAVALDNDTALVGAWGHDINGVSSGAAYVFTRTGTMWNQQAKLVPDDGAAYDLFGVSVALDGDTALIGAFQDNDNGYRSGSAYIFTRVASTWSQQTKLLADDGAIYDAFGVSVALDGNTALIGARGALGTYATSGKAYVFTSNDSMWTQQAKLVPNDGFTSDWFGVSVALHGDTALVGAMRDNDNGTESGSAYVFTRTGTMWSQQAKLVPDDGAAEDWFGHSVALYGDTALVGVPYDNDHGTHSGSVYVFTRFGSAWTQQPKLDRQDATTIDHFGYSVTIDYNTAFVGADHDGNAIGSGSAYVFVFDSVPLTVNVTCNNEDLVINNTSGDGPFNITASAGINTPINGVNIGTTTINGPEKWDDVTVTETSGDFESINLGTFKCRSVERPVPVSPAHQAHITNPFPLFTWTGITDANNYRVWVFDDATPANRTVDIRQNSGGPTQLTLTQPLSPDRYFWRVRGRQNRIWSLWSIRFTLFIDPPLASPMTISTTPVPLDAPNVRPTLLPPPTSEPSSDGAPVTPTLPTPPNSR